MTVDGKFLRDVASFCCSGGAGCELARLAFVLPNKRAAMFLKKYMRECVADVVMMPRFMTMRTFLAIFADKPEGTDLQQLFILYDAYRKVLAAHGRSASVREFDSFIFWGDMMLADFDDIDKSFVDAAEIFKNLKDVKEIQADYLDDEQKAIVRRVWGESRLTADISEFWLHLAEDAPADSLSGKFLYLWEIMADIYKEFYRRLDAEGLATAGRQYRSAVDGVRHRQDFDFGPDTRYAFVGFNDLSCAETLIFGYLRDAGAALFFWDTAPLALCDTSGDIPRPLQRLTELAKAFPAPDGFEVSPRRELPRVSVTAVPSNVGQAKAIRDVLSRWAAEGHFDCANPINTAVVIPDQGLLLPALMSVPQQIGSVNISMGLPFRTTNFASLLHSIVSMQLRARRLHGICHFYYEDVIAVLQHPHIRAVAAADADAIVRHISEGRVYNLAATSVVEVAPALRDVFVPLHDLNNVREAGAYLDNLLQWLGAALAEAGGGGVPPFELTAIDYFRAELAKLSALVEKHGVSMSNRTFLHLFERVFASRALALTGKPLQGLQVLGVLETRALDFDNVIILSMNEGIFPKRQYGRTMIPNSLRHGFCLPDFDSLEWTYAYCFYRLVARARNVAIFYDSRSEGKGKGERSRYISQMKYLMPSLHIDEYELTTGATPTPPREFCVTKDEAVMRELAAFKPGGRSKVSAAALKEYLKCPFSFYLKYVRGLRGSDEMVDYVTNADYGNIVHGTIQSLFEPYKNCEVTAAHFDRWLDPDNPAIERTVEKELLALRRQPGTDADGGELNAEGQIAKDAIVAIVRADLEAEKAKYCTPSFVFIDNEMQVNTFAGAVPWKIDDDLTLNFYMSVDRVDRDASGKLRFVDFKTGNEKTAFDSLDSVFSRENTDRHGAFQLLTYCEAYLSIVDAEADIKPLIHPMREIIQKNPVPDMKYNRRPIESYRNDIRDDFRPRLHALLHEIFGPEGCFCQRADNNGCQYCNFMSLCGRAKPQQF